MKRPLHPLVPLDKLKQVVADLVAVPKSKTNKSKTKVRSSKQARKIEPKS